MVVKFFKKARKTVSAIGDEILNDSAEEATKTFIITT